MSLAGDRALVGADEDRAAGAISGSVYVFERDANGNWIQVAKLLPDDGTNGDLFGGSVCLSGDRALVGADGDSDQTGNSGSAYLFERHESGDWLQVDKLLPADGALRAEFGSSVSLADDRALVGAQVMSFVPEMPGAAYLFERDAGGSWLQVDKILASDGALGDQFGASVSLSGPWVLVGAPYDSDNGTYSGSAYLFNTDGLLRDGFEE